MRVSGKVTHSFYCFLRHCGFDVSQLFEFTSLEMEFIKDPSQWMDITEVETFLKKLNQEYSRHFVDQSFLVKVGYACVELGAWGDLDSVLKMRKSDLVFSQIPVFLSYFISDEFSIVSERDEKQLLSLKCNLSLEDYPFLTEYLQAVLETLPMYSGKSRAKVKWIRDYIQIQWDSKNTQASLFPTAPSSVNIKPELLSDFRNFLEKIEVDLYQQRQQIIKKDKEIRYLKDQLLMRGLALPEDLLVVIQQIEKTMLELKSTVFVEAKEGLENNNAVISENILSQLENLFTSLTHLREILNIKL